MGRDRPNLTVKAVVREILAQEWTGIHFPVSGSIVRRWSPDPAARPTEGLPAQPLDRRPAASQGGNTLRSLSAATDPTDRTDPDRSVRSHAAASVTAVNPPSAQNDVST
jgi:hypothetical protein